MDWNLVNDIIDQRIIMKNGTPAEAVIEDDLLLSDEGIMSTEVLNTINEVLYLHSRNNLDNAERVIWKALSTRYPKISKKNVSKVQHYYAYACTPSISH